MDSIDSAIIDGIEYIRQITKLEPQPPPPPPPPPFIKAGR